MNRTIDRASLVLCSGVLVALAASNATAAPSISSVVPSSGSTTGGATLTISGTAFRTGGGNQVTVGGRSCTPTFESETEIQCTCPEGLGLDQEVEVTADGETGGGQYFDYNPPAISSLEPDNGPTQGNVPITIHGSNFGPASADAERSVTVGTTACPLVASSSDHFTVVCTLPAGQGAGNSVQVTAAGQASNSLTLNYDEPDIDSVSPARASAAGGTLLTITGSNFGLSAGVLVDGQSCPLTMQSHTELRCTGPAAPAGDFVPVLVEVSGQIGASTIDYETPACGNGVHDTTVGEVCDDGNLDSGDGCSSDCRAEVPQDKEQVRCILGMNKAAANLFVAGGKEALACAILGNGPDCIGIHSMTYAAVYNKVQAAEDNKCSTPPDFGKASVPAVQTGVADQAHGLITDMFGLDPDTALAPDAMAPNRGDCQNAVLKAELKFAAARIKAFNRCKKAGFRLDEILSDSQLGDCLEAADAEPIVTKPQQAQFATMLDSCINVGEDRAAAFPGVCSGATDTAACLDQRVRCRTCLALKAADALPIDCDDDDDGLANASCE